MLDTDHPYPTDGHDPIIIVANRPLPDVSPTTSSEGSRAAVEGSFADSAEKRGRVLEAYRVFALREHVDRRADTATG